MLRLTRRKSHFLGFLFCSIYLFIYFLGGGGLRIQLTRGKLLLPLMVRSVLSRSPRAANEARREGLLVVYLHGSRTHHWLRSIVGYLALKALVKLGGPLVPFMFVRFFFFFLRQNWYFVVSFKLRVVLHSAKSDSEYHDCFVNVWFLFVCLFVLPYGSWVKWEKSSQLRGGPEHKVAANLIGNRPAWGGIKISKMILVI